MLLLGILCSPSLVAVSALAGRSHGILAGRSHSTTHSVAMVEAPPKVSAPVGFEAPVPQPLTLTRPGELPGLLSGGIALALRLATGVFCLGWSPKLLIGAEADTIGPEAGKYGFRVGPLAFRDTSPLLIDAPRPAVPPILYEYEASPFCRKVREAALVLDLTLELRPCPGARAGFAEELKERTGRMTVPYLVDPNTGTEMFEVRRVASESTHP
jgi:hypothetical protein